MIAVLLTLLFFLPQETEPAASWKLTIFSTQTIYHPDQPCPVRFLIENPTEDEMKLAEPADYLQGLQITAPDGTVLKTHGNTFARKREILSDGHGFVGRTVDIAPALQIPDDKEGKYSLQWKFGDAVSAELILTVVHRYEAEIETAQGSIVLEFFRGDAPKHVERFLGLARSGFYDGSRFHRIIPKFMMQGGGAPEGRETPKPLRAEFNNRIHRKGTVSMARTKDPHSATSQFFICFERLESLDGNYTVFANVTRGLETVEAVEKVETDHTPCKKCGASLSAGWTSHCGQHHADQPVEPVVIKKVTIRKIGSLNKKDQVKGE